MTHPAAETRSVIVEREIAYPAEKIWRALTQPLLIEEWLMKNDFKPVEGHKFKLRRDSQADIGVIVDCEILSVKPNRTLSYKWSAYGVETIVTFTITPTTAGTHLRVEQSGFQSDQRRAYNGARASWPQFLAALEKLLARVN